MTEPNGPEVGLSPEARAFVEMPTGHQIRTDRPCARCGFNLFGQPIVREPHYGLVAARCPECGQLAALQEYPALGKWADRWAKLLAAAWVLVLIGALGALFGPMVGFNFVLLESSSNGLGHTIGSRFTEWQQSQSMGVIQQQVFYGSGAWTPVEVDWWQEHRTQILEEFAADPRRVPQGATLVWVLLGLVCLCAGVFCSVSLLGARRRVALVIGAIPVVLAVSIAWWSGPSMAWGTNTIMARDAARIELRSTVLPFTGALMTVALLIGVWQGRRIARAVVRLSLPPRMRSALAILWTRDGLPAPSSRGD